MATMTATTTPTNVGNAYDQISEYFSKMLGGCIHVGYWDNDTSDQPVEAATDRLTSMVAQRLAILPGANKRILDVGCGTGKPVMQIASLCKAHVTGITVSKRQIELAQAKAAQGPDPERVSFQFANAMELPFAEKSFDGAYAIESLVHMHDKAAALGNVARVLRPGSRLVIADLFVGMGSDAPDAEFLARMCKSFELSTIINVDEYKLLLKNAGFRLVDFTDIRQNVRRTYDIMAASFRDNLPACDAQIAEQLRAVTSDMSRIGTIGYALITAERE